MAEYIQFFSILTLVFFSLAAIKYPARKLIPKTGVYKVLVQAHRPFAIASWLCITAHGAIVVSLGAFSITGLILYIFLNALIILGAYKTYINKRLSFRIFKYHKLLALTTIFLFALHHLAIGGVFS